MTVNLFDLEPHVTKIKYFYLKSLYLHTSFNLKLKGCSNLVSEPYSCKRLYFRLSVCTVYVNKANKLTCFGLCCALFIPGITFNNKVPLV